jgi:large subunit ribosomal protein L24
MARKWKIRSGDEVVVTAGQSKGKSGRITKVFKDKERVLIQGVNMIRRHTKPTQASPGGIVKKEASIHVSNVAVMDSTNGKPTRIGFKFLEDGRKVRFSKRTGEIFDKK